MDVINKNNNETLKIQLNIHTTLETTTSNDIHVINKNQGTGAGGANTNKNGLSWEDQTNISSSHLILVKQETLYKLYKLGNKTLIVPKSKTGLSKILTEMNLKDITIIAMHGCKYPDECFIDLDGKTIVILEKKYQQKGGSVCEKLQTADAKIYNFKKMYPNFKIEYIYCLNNWFKKNCIAELEYLDYRNIKYFWGEDENFKSDFCDYLINL